MRIYTNKSLLFRNGEERVKIKNFEITNVPGWVEKTLLFKLAKKDGTLTVIENNEQRVAAENGDLNKPKNTGNTKGNTKGNEKASDNEEDKNVEDKKAK